MNNNALFIDTRGSLYTLLRGFHLLGQFHTYEEALAAYLSEEACMNREK